MRAGDNRAYDDRLSSSPKIIAGRYEIVRQIGEGGMGAVYEARHLTTGRRVAVKLMLNESLTKGTGRIERFVREARAAGAIESQHIAQVLDVGADAETGHPFMVLEYLEGSDLQQLIERLGPLRPSLAMKIIAQACVGLSKAHAAGIIHRDIKPANLFVARRDSGEVVVKLLDFGVAKISVDDVGASGNTSLTRTGTMLGSPQYMSPEQGRGEKTIDSRADVWSLGIVLHEALTGRSPLGHVESLGALIMAINTVDVTDVQEDAPWVTTDVKEIVTRALRRERGERFQSADEMLAALQALVPEGSALHESMLTPMTDEERPFAVRAPVAVDVHAATITTAAVSQETFQRSRQTSRASRALGRTAIASAVGVVAIGAIGITMVVAMRRDTAPATSSAAERKPQGEALPEAAPNAAKTVYIHVPSGGSARVDGADVPVVDGAIAVSGSLGTNHEVWVSLGTREKLQKIAITTEGAVPDRVDLPPEASPRAETSSRPLASVVPTGTSRRVVATAASGAAKPPPTPAPPASIAIGREHAEFN